MLHIHPVPAFRDNYIWIIHNQRDAVVVDPGEAAPAIEFLQQHRLRLNAILITHHHSDHTGGIAQLQQWHDAPVYGPAAEAIAAVTQPLREHDRVILPALPLDLSVIDIAGHTRGHIAYYGATPFNMVFCGDTLFACGCGRVFEGTPPQMYQSLQKLSRLPDDTLIYCTHEYTLGNVAFATTIDPDNAALTQFAAQAQQLRQQNLPTLPVTLGLERTINPFLRCDQALIIASAQHHCGHTLADPESVFTVLREWKNNF